MPKKGEARRQPDASGRDWPADASQQPHLSKQAAWATSVSPSGMPIAGNRWLSRRSGHDPSAGSDWMPSVAESAGSKSFSFCGYPPRLSVKTPTLFCVQYPSGHSMQPVAAGHRRHGSSSRLPTGVSARGGYG